MQGNDDEITLRDGRRWRCICICARQNCVLRKHRFLPAKHYFHLATESWL